MEHSKESKTYIWRDNGDGETFERTNLEIIYVFKYSIYSDS